MSNFLHPAVSRTWIAVDHPDWEQAHASTVVRTADYLVTAWFAGTREGTPDNRIWLSRRRDSQWSAPVVVASGDTAHWNPVLAQGADGRVWLFYKVGARISEWRTMVKTSEDDGATWSTSQVLTEDGIGGRGPVKNPPLVVDGAWVAGGSTERWSTDLRWDCFVDISLDNGATWHKVPLVLERKGLRGAGAIQPALWSNGSSVFALARSTEGYAFRAESKDGGFTWTPLVATELANNNSGLTVAALPNGTVVCVHNPVAGDWASRCPLGISITQDDGKTWTSGPIIEDGRTALEGSVLVPRTPEDSPGFHPADSGVVTTGVGEYSYPAALVDGDELVITYTWQRRGIVEARVPLQALDPVSASEQTNHEATNRER